MNAIAEQKVPPVDSDAQCMDAAAHGEKVVTWRFADSPYVLSLGDGGYAISCGSYKGAHAILFNAVPRQAVGSACLNETTEYDPTAEDAIILFGNAKSAAVLLAKLASLVARMMAEESEQTAEAA